MIDNFVSYARVRFGDSLSVELRGGANPTLYLQNPGLRTAGIEVIGMGDSFDFAAGAYFFEATGSDATEIFQRLDLAMTYGMVEVRRILRVTRIGADAELQALIDKPRTSVLNRWEPWQGSVVSRADAAARFDFPILDTYVESAGVAVR